MAYRRAGEGAPILLVHGITNDSLSWDPVLSAWPAITT